MTFFLLSTDIQKAYQTHEFFLGNGHINDTFFVSGRNSIAVSNFKKQRITDSQTYIIDSENWILLSGTIIYKGYLGGDALKYILDDFKSSGSVDRIREDCLGNYALAISVNWSVYIFSDPWSTRKVFYNSRTDQDCKPIIAVSTSLRAVEISCDNPQAQDEGIAAFALAYDGMLGITPFKNIHRLLGDEYIAIDFAAKSNELKLKRTKFSYFKSIGCDASFVDAGSLSKRYYDHARLIFQSIAQYAPHGVFTSGGRDSRTVLAGLMAAGVSPAYIFSFQSTSELADANPIDATVAIKIADLLGSTHYLLNHACIQPYTSEQLISLFSKWGYELSSAYNSNIGLDQEHRFGITPYPLLMLGGFSSFFAHARWGGIEDRTYNIQDLLRFFSLMSEGFFEASGIAVKDMLAEFIERTLGYTPKQMTKKQFIDAIYLLRIDGDSGNITEMNRYGYYLAPFHCHSLGNPFILLNPDVTAKDNLQMSLIANLYPPLLEVPFYSSHKWWRLNKKDLTLVPPRGDYKHYLKKIPGLARNVRLIKKILNKFGIISDACPAMQGTTSSPLLRSTQSHRIRQSMNRLIQTNLPNVSQYWNPEFFRTGYLPQANGLIMRLFAYANRQMHKIQNPE
jgi:hypothetical protein